MSKSHYLKNQNGIAMGMAIFALAAAVGVSFYVYNSSMLLNKSSGARSKDVRVQVVKEKLSRMAGFLVANNLIVCRQSQWTDGTQKETCQWNKKNFNGSSRDYEPKDFFLNNKGLDAKQNLTLEVDVEKMLGDSTSKGLLSGKNTWMKFVLKHGSKINAELGKVDDSIKINNRDEYYIVLEGNIEYKGTSGKNQSEPFASVFRRPIAIPKVEITSTSCAQRCDVSLVEHPNPACRSEFYIDEQTMTDISASTTNLGPGMIYSLSYQRTTAYNNGAILKESSEAATKVEVDIGDYIVPGATKNWADVFPCGTLSQSVKKEVIVRHKGIDLNLFTSPFTIPLLLVYSPEANAQWVKTQVGSTTTSALSQHSNPAGTVIYQVNPSSPNLSNIEPYRMTAPLSEPPQQFTGLMNTTTTTNVYTWVYYDPPH